MLTDPTCDPVTMWFLSRHGTRFSRVEDQERIFNQLRDDILPNAEQGQ